MHQGTAEALLGQDQAHKSLLHDVPGWMASASTCYGILESAMLLYMVSQMSCLDHLLTLISAPHSGAFSPESCVSHLCELQGVHA